MTVADRIKERRTELGMTQTELANKIGAKDKSSISRIESKGNEVSLKDIVRISRALSTSPKYLLGYESPELDEIVAYEENLYFDEKRQKRKEYFNLCNDAQQVTELYMNASPEIQKAVKILLESKQ